ncbi:hypothetical protein [Clostridium sp. KNHs214]|nr:hypothetical protein [Clostridium sp. KNHs214]
MGQGWLKQRKTIGTEFKNLTSSNSEIKGMNNCIDPDTEEK